MSGYRLQNLNEKKERPLFRFLNSKALSLSASLNQDNIILISARLMPEYCAKASFHSKTVLSAGHPSIF